MHAHATRPPIIDARTVEDIVHAEPPAFISPDAIVRNFQMVHNYRMYTQPSPDNWLRELNRLHGETILRSDPSTLSEGPGVKVVRKKMDWVWMRARATRAAMSINLVRTTRRERERERERV